MLYALGFIGLFTIGGMTGLFLASLAVDVHLSDTYFVVAHFHYIMVGGALMGYLGGLHYWWPKITGRMYPEGWGQILRARDLRRIQSDVPAAVCCRLSGHAATLSRLSAGVSGVQRALDRGRIDSWVRHVDSCDLLRLVHALRQDMPKRIRGTCPDSSGARNRRRRLRILK